MTGLAGLIYRALWDTLGIQVIPEYVTITRFTWIQLFIKPSSKVFRLQHQSPRST